MALLIDKTKNFIESIWFSVIICLVTVISFMLNLPYLGFYFAVCALLLIVLLKADFKATLPIIILVYGNHQTFSRDFKDPKLIILISLFSIVILLYLLNVIRNRNAYFNILKKDYIFYTLIGISIAMLLSLINTPVIQESLIGIVMWITILFSYVLIRTTVKPSEENEKHIILSIILSGWVIVLELAYMYFLRLKSGLSISEIVMNKTLGLGWAHLNHIAAFFNLCFIVANLYFLKMKNMKARIFSLISMISFLFCSLITLCRAGYFTLTFIVPIVLIVDIIYLLKSNLSSKKKILYLSSAVIVICVTIFALSLGNFFDPILQGIKSRKFSLSGREKVYEIAWKRFIAHPIFGSGVYTARYYLEPIEFGIYNYHNHYLQILATCGIIGGLAFTGFLFFSIKRNIKNNLFSLFTLIVMLYFLIHGALDTLFFNTYIMPILCVLLAITNDAKIIDEFPSLFQKKNDENNDELGKPEIETD